LEESECLRLIGSGGIGRIAYSGRFGPAVLPVNYKMHDGAVVFRTAVGSPLDEDLRTGIAGADYQVAFEMDEIDPALLVDDRRGRDVPLVQQTDRLLDRPVAAYRHHRRRHDLANQHGAHLQVSIAPDDHSARQGPKVPS
jgi:Pyridoxamine 5'-phosphate oxidase